MSARYEERSLGVYDRKADALVVPGTGAWKEYQEHLAETGEQPDSSPDAAGPTLAQARTEKIALIENLAGDIRRKVVGRASPQEMASWTMKAEQARAYLASANPLDASLLSGEAAARGTTLDAIVARVVNNSTAFLRAESLIAGVCGKHKDAVAGLATVDEILAYDIDAGWDPLYP
jgi:hypothetical protein